MPTRPVIRFASSGASAQEMKGREVSPREHTDSPRGVAIIIPGPSGRHPAGAGQVRGAYSIESNGQSRSTHARTASWSTTSSAAQSARTQDWMRGAALGAAARLTAAGRVDVHAADDVPVAGAEHGVGEPAAFGKVLLVALQVAEIVTQGHLARPAAIGEPRCRPDVVNAGCPGGVISLVVLGSERGQSEVPGYQPVGCGEVFRNEQLIAHPGILTRLRRQEACPCLYMTDLLPGILEDTSEPGNVFDATTGLDGIPPDATTFPSAGH